MKEPWQEIYKEMRASAEQGMIDRGSELRSRQVDEALEAAAKQIHRLQERIDRLELLVGGSGEEE